MNSRINQALSFRLVTALTKSVRQSHSGLSGATVKLNVAKQMTQSSTSIVAESAPRVLVMIVSKSSKRISVELNFAKMTQTPNGLTGPSGQSVLSHVALPVCHIVSVLVLTAQLTPKPVRVQRQCRQNHVKT